MSKLESLMYLEINLVAVILVIIIRCKTQGLSQMVAQRNFMYSINSMVVFFLSDTLCTMMNWKLIAFNLPIFYLSKSAYFLSTALMCYFWFIYFEYLHDSAFIKDRRNIWFSSIMVVIMLILVVVNYFNGALFYLDEANNYYRGPLFMALYILPYSYVLVSSLRAVVALFTGHSKANRKTLFLLAMFPIPPAFAGISQLYFPSLPVACSALSLEVLIMYLDWMDQIISIDPLTRLNNRKQFIYYFDHLHPDENRNSHHYLLMIDADHFKAINDTYGHVEGDIALVRIADALRSSFHGLEHRASIARYGGDEFIALVEVNDEEQIANIISSIRSNLHELNVKAKAPYDLSVSIGVSELLPGVSLKQLVEEADEHLYQEKHR